MTHDPGAAARAPAFSFNDNGSLRWIEWDGLCINLFAASGVEGGPANLWLRHVDGDATEPEAVPLLGPASPLVRVDDAAAPHAAAGRWRALAVSLDLVTRADPAGWAWHVTVRNEGTAPMDVDLVSVQDVGLASRDAIRLNEYYVSHYVDLAPIEHPVLGTLLAARQNQAAQGRHPWLVAGSLNGCAAWATDGRQVTPAAVRAGASLTPPAQLPGRRLQHEHAVVALQSRRLHLEPGAGGALGIFVRLVGHHPRASGADDLALADAWLAHAAAAPPLRAVPAEAPARARSRFDTAPMLAAHDAGDADLAYLQAGPRRHEEWGEGGLWSFFHGDDAHVVLRAKELAVQRPHGHLLRSGTHLTPDETAMTSTAWMGGVFHSMVTQGHVGINRFLTTTRGWLGWFRSHGLRVFVDAGDGADDGWRLLGLPTAFEMRPSECRWLYRHDGGLLEVRAAASERADTMALQVRVVEGEPQRLLVSLNLALGGDDGLVPEPSPWRRDGAAIVVEPPPGSALAQRFPEGSLRVEIDGVASTTHVGGDELLFVDGRSRGEPFLCLRTLPAAAFGLRLVGALVDAPPVVEVSQPPRPRLSLTAGAAGALDVARLDDVLPWFQQNAFVHYLSPRGLEQFSGGGWGTRDVCQGPLEMLLALGRSGPVRDLLARVFSAQNADGDWPQWFQFFERERDIRAGDSHGDIVFWPLLGLARYLLASADAAFLQQPLPFHDAPPEPLQDHVERALSVIAQRVIPGTVLAAYGHGDWNDSMQPADPRLRDSLCSAWTVTLHHQTLSTLADALRGPCRDPARADALQAQARRIRSAFRDTLIADGVIAGYARFDPASAQPVLLLHPRDADSGVHDSLLPMIHAVTEDLLDAPQVQAHFERITRHLSGPDGARLFDAPLPYRGGLQRLFQRAETCAFFGREIGLMYTHAHLRYAQALAHAGRAHDFFDALMRVVPIGLADRVPSASPRQSNCYYSSSDAAFADRAEAHAHYGRIRRGEVALDGGWRVYSSGPGIAVGLVMEHLLGLRQQHDALVLDPVMPAALDGLVARTTLWGHEVAVHYAVGPRGHGPVRVSTPRHELPATRLAHALRTGGLRLARTAIEAEVGPGVLELRVELG